MPVRPLPDQSRNLNILNSQLQEGELLLVGFDEPGRAHGGRALRSMTEPELTRCIRAANAKPIIFYGVQRTQLLEHHRLGWR